MSLKSEIKVIAVDDEPSMRDLISKVLVRAGCTVTTAINGESGLKAIFEGYFDVVILDLDMPGIHGTEVCRAVRQNPNTAALPIIIVSGSLNEETKTDCENAGASDCLAKPFNGTTLAQCVLAHAHAKRRAMS